MSNLAYTATASSAATLFLVILRFVFILVFIADSG